MMYERIKKHQTCKASHHDVAFDSKSNSVIRVEITSHPECQLWTVVDRWKFWSCQEDSAWDNPELDGGQEVSQHEYAWWRKKYLPMSQLKILRYDLTFGILFRNQHLTDNYRFFIKCRPSLFEISIYFKST